MGDPQPKNASRLISGALAFVLVAAVFLVGLWIGGHPRQTGLDRLTPALRDRFLASDRTAVGTEVLAILEDDYYKPLDPTTVAKLQDASASSLVEALGDPYTQYLNKDAYGKFLQDRSGTYVGVGIEWHPEGEVGRIVRVVPGGPAEKAGLKAADAIVAVDGTPVTAKDQYAVMDTVKGQEGTPVTLRIVRAKEKPRDFTMKRAEIRERVVESRVENRNGRRIGYVRLHRFTSGSATAFRDAVKQVEAQKVTGLVFDLRGDPGGLVDEAIKIVAVFLPDNSAVVRTKSRDGESETLRTEGNPAIPANLPVVLLVDRNSASASEIVSGALRDAGRAKLVGTRTFGKALIQTTRTLPDGGALKYTTASYLTPKGFDLGTRGLPADIAVSDDAKTSADEVLQRGLAAVAGS